MAVSVQTLPVIMKHLSQSEGGVALTLAAAVQGFARFVGYSFRFCGLFIDWMVAVGRGCVMIHVMLTSVIGTGVAGLLLLFLEMFLPGLVAGILGAILLIVSIAMAYLNLGPAAGNAALLIAAASTGGLWWWWATRFQHTRFGRSMTLESTVASGAVADGLPGLAGKTGSALTTLRPSGTVMVEGRRVDAMTDGEFIEAGTAIKVVRAHGLGVVVRRTE